MDQKQLEKFRSVIASLPDNFYVLVTQVDPDALGSALALLEILKKLGRKSSLPHPIIYCGAASHAQNRAIINRFGLANLMRPIADFGAKGTEVVLLVDSSENNDGRIPEAFRPIKPVVVIDHHEGGEPSGDDGQFFWVDRIGAASTLMSELVEALEFELSKEASMTLALGIYTDTHNLMSASERDHAAFSRLTKKVDPNTLKWLINFSYPESYFVHLEHALQNQTIKGSRLVSNLGYIAADEGDDISTVADYLIRRMGTNLVVAWAIVGDKQVRICARSDNPSLILDQELRTWFGNGNAGAKVAPDGRGEGGAVVKMDLGFWGAGVGSKDLVLELVSRRINEVVSV